MQELSLAKKTWVAPAITDISYTQDAHLNKQTGQTEGFTQPLPGNPPMTVTFGVAS